MIEGLKGAAKDAEGAVTFETLAIHVRKRVPRDVKQIYGADGGEQRPNVISNLSGEPVTLATITNPSTEPGKPAEPPKITPSEPMPVTNVNFAEPKPQQTKEIPKSRPRESKRPSNDRFAGSRAGQIRKDNGANLPLIWIPPGKFTMGSPSDEKDRDKDEEQVQVTLTKGFWLGQYEVTQAEWQRVMQMTPWGRKVYVKRGTTIRRLMSAGTTPYEIRREAD